MSQIRQLLSVLRWLANQPVQDPPVIQEIYLGFDECSVKLSSPEGGRFGTVVVDEAINANGKDIHTATYPWGEVWWAVPTNQLPKEAAVKVSDK